MISVDDFGSIIDVELVLDKLSLDVGLLLATAESGAENHNQDKNTKGNGTKKERLRVNDTTNVELATTSGGAFRCRFGCDLIKIFLILHGYIITLNGDVFQ